MKTNKTIDLGEIGNPREDDYTWTCYYTLTDKKTKESIKYRFEFFDSSDHEDEARRVALEIIEADEEDCDVEITYLETDGITIGEADESWADHIRYCQSLIC